MTIGLTSTEVQPKQTKKTETVGLFQEFSVEAANKIIDDNLALIMSNKSSYKSITRLAATFTLTDKDFRARCAEDKKLMNKLTIYNSLILEQLMLSAIKTGKMNKQTDDYLRDEMQAYTNTGTEQNVTQVWFKPEDIVVKKLTDKYRADFDTEIEIIPDVDIKIDAEHETIFDIMEKDDNA